MKNMSMSVRETLQSKLPVIVLFLSVLAVVPVVTMHPHLFMQLVAALKSIFTDGLAVAALTVGLVLGVWISKEDPTHPSLYFERLLLFGYSIGITAILFAAFHLLPVAIAFATMFLGVIFGILFRKAN